MDRALKYGAVLYAHDASPHGASIAGAVSAGLPNLINDINARTLTALETLNGYPSTIDRPGQQHGHLAAIRYPSRPPS